jgi:hypothetical protein
VNLSLSLYREGTVEGVAKIENLVVKNMLKHASS